jgi:Carbohydrate family 9 binding domain-like
MNKALLVLLLMIACTQNVSCVSIKACTVANITLPPFVLSGSGQLPSEQTTAQLCHSNARRTLHAHYTVVDNFITSPFSECNSPLYKADAVEMFIEPAALWDRSFDERKMKRNNVYIELEASPNAVLFVSNITNSDDACSGIAGNEIACSSSGVTVSARRTDDGYVVDMSVPLALVDAGHGVSTQFRANFFRIDHSQSAATQYQAWRADGANPPCFHVPSAFGLLSLD